MARPTQSQPLYIQMIGRGLRLPENIANLKKLREQGALRPEMKTECIIIDVVDNWAIHNMEVVTALTLFGTSGTEEDNTSTQGDTIRNPLTRPGGRAPAPAVFNAVSAASQEIDLFARRNKHEKTPKMTIPALPKQVAQGPLAGWKALDHPQDAYKVKLLRMIVRDWEPISCEVPFSLKRLKLDHPYEVAISSSAQRKWFLSVRSSDGRPYSRAFDRLADAFGCAELFVHDQTQMEQAFRTHEYPRTNAVFPVHKCLLSIYGENVTLIRTLAQAEQKILERLWSSQIPR